MSDPIRFTRNYEDLSTDRGFQFEFFCDVCGNGFRSPYKANVTGTVTDVLRGASNLFGGILGRVSDASYEVQRAVGGKAHDEAFREAVEAIRPHFRQCHRCGKWVCPDVCWNEAKGLCVECAPKLEQEMASTQQEVMLEQMREKMRSTDFVKDMNVVDDVVARCPHCGAETKGGKFCMECGGKLTADNQCQRCGAKLPEKAKFCLECGTPVQR